MWLELSLAANVTALFQMWSFEMLLMQQRLQASILSAYWRPCHCFVAIRSSLYAVSSSGSRGITNSGVVKGTQREARCFSFYFSYCLDI